MAKFDAILSEFPDSGVLTPAMLDQEYEPHSYADAFEAVQDYRRVRQRHAETGEKSAGLAADLEVPRGRIRSWLNGSAPDLVPAIVARLERG